MGARTDNDPVLYATEVEVEVTYDMVKSYISAAPREVLATIAHQVQARTGFLDDLDAARTARAGRDSPSGRPQVVSLAQWTAAHPRSTGG